MMEDLGHIPPSMDDLEPEQEEAGHFAIWLKLKLRPFVNAGLRQNQTAASHSLLVSLSQCIR